MLVRELFETTADDRSIIATASTLAKKLRDMEYTRAKNVGSIGKLVPNSSPELHDVIVKIGSDKHLGSDVGGLYDPGTNTVWVNFTILGYPNSASLIAHELRHALDHIKSKGKAFLSTKYSTPKKKEHRTSNHPEIGDAAYLADPGEINARLVEVAREVLLSLHKEAKKGNPDLESLRASGIMSMYRHLDEYDIGQLFPERTESKQYKRLVSRIMQLVDNEAGKLIAKYSPKKQ